MLHQRPPAAFCALVSPRFRAGVVRGGVLWYIKKIEIERDRKTLLVKFHRKAGAPWMFCVSNRPTAETATNASGSARSSHGRVYQGHAQIISSDCILCGNCVSVCPQHAKEDISDVGQIRRSSIASGKQVVVSVDSSYIAYFDTPGFQGIEKPLKALGFLRRHTKLRRAPIWSRRSWKSSPPSRAMRRSSPRAVRRSCSMWKSICPRRCRISLRCSRRCRRMPCCCASAIRARPLSTSVPASPRRRRRRALRASAPIMTSPSRSSRSG